MPLGLGIWEILILAGILVLLFGAKGAPAMARRLGSGVKEMKDAVTEMDPRSILDPKGEVSTAKALPALEAAKPEAVPAAEAAAAPKAAATRDDIAAPDVASSDVQPPAR